MGHRNAMLDNYIGQTVAITFKNGEMYTGKLGYDTYKYYLDNCESVKIDGSGAVYKNLRMYFYKSGVKIKKARYMVAPYWWLNNDEGGSIDGKTN